MFLYCWQRAYLVRLRKFAGSCGCEAVQAEPHHVVVRVRGGEAYGLLLPTSLEVNLRLEAVQAEPHPSC